ncbi:Transient receptor potential cation channel trpm [Mizuhopecten yessoensis]|uniref:Transient receptor potential cation channel trpm n=1 Tax=Mizuhopecten yessoensis TaxID=6573 RepID=A0A210QEF1_MIZYE|nr:Transient receptor potential cation channel trpm [Mizuhopecten yessoensis]
MSESSNKERHTASYVPVALEPAGSPDVGPKCRIGSVVRSASTTIYSPSNSNESSIVDGDPSETGYFFDEDADLNQRTVTSFGGLSIDTQDSARYNDAPFDCGNIQFSDVNSQKQEREPKRHYVCIPSDTVSWDVAHFLGSYWKMRSPKIVLSVISGVKHFKPWKNLRFKKQFQKGIIKAANTTEMWIVTSGLDGGVSKMIGDAIREEKARRISNRTQQSMIRPDAVQKFQKLTLIGILPKDGLKYGDKLDGSEGVGLKNEGHQPDSDKYELNPDHTHFMIVEEEDLDRMLFTNIRCTLEKAFEYQLGRPRRLRRVFSWGSDESNTSGFNDMHQPNDKTIPVIGLLVQGSPKNVEHILFYLSNKMPVVVLKGSGGFADLLAFAYQETQERTDPDFLETFLKPELIKMISKTYPSDFKDNDLARNEFRDKILNCVDLAQEDDQTFMTVVNMQGWDANLKDLDKYLLKALFKSEKQVASKWKEQLYKDLQLILDWNRPDLVQSQIFQRDDFAKIKLNKELLEKALLKTDREEFVDLFLDHGIQIHKFLNHKKFKLLFERAQEREFFTTICLEGALNFSSVVSINTKEFLSNDLNRLIYKLSRIKDFVQPYELSMNSAGLYVSNPAVAESKALNCLIVWAVLMNRHKLAKVLWQRCEEPIAMALICSNMYRELAKNCIELYLRTEMENNANDFGKIALGVLDISFRDSSAQAYNILCKPLPHFNNKTTLEIAHDANYMNFIAHPCCQKWLTKKLFGAIHVKEVPWGIFRLPYWFKILASVFLIFPMFIWINFSPGALRRVKGITVNDTILMEDEEEEEGETTDSNDEEDAGLPSSKSMLENELSNMRKAKSLKSVKVRIKSAMKSNKKRHLALWRRIQLLWSAPITKFWLTQALYFVYLGLFCLAVLWPTCGNLTLDLIVWLWTAVILTELVRRTYVKHQKYKTVSLFSQCAEITFILIFLIFYLFLRIIPHWLVYANINAAKTVLSVGLIYFFYRLLGTYMPISPTLGPMLVRMTRMVKHDFVAFIRMFLIFLISGGVTIQAVLYPNYPLGYDLIKKVLTRPLFAMFLTKIDDLDGTPACNAYNDANMSTHHCLAEPTQPGPELPDHIISCSVGSIGGYLIVIQYLLICKLVLVTLLFAMFALTITKVDKEAGQIWKFQRYALIVDFEERLCLPPPLTLISYITMVLVFFYSQLFGCHKGCLCCCCFKKQAKRKKTEKMVHKVQRIKQSQDYNYWQKCASEYITTQDNEQESQTIVNKQTEIINSIQEDMNFQKKNMRLLNNRIVELEKIMLSSRMYLENIYHKLDKTDVFGVSNTKGQIIHITARQSPYPGTRIARFPVFDKYVPWEQAYDVYDPKIYTKPKDQFCEDEMVFVDEDLIQLKKAQEERDRMTEEEKESLPPLAKFSPKWNSVVTYRQESHTRAIDRRSWISFNNQPLRYSLDPMETPINSMGRTGLRGRGLLWRWGPNHVIKAVCTRWRHKYSDNEDAQTGFLYVEGKRVLEFIAIKKLGDEVTMDSGSTYGLPGGALHGHISPYSMQCQAFMRDVLMEDQDPKNNLDQADMIQYFAQFSANVSTPVRTPVTQLPSPVSSATTQMSSIQPFLTRTNSRTSLRTHGDGDSSGFSASLLYKGYVDDPRNTDNAWVEAEVWNFHYDAGDTFDSTIPEDSSPTWKEVSPNVKIFGNEGAIVQEAAKIHDAYH